MKRFTEEEKDQIKELLCWKRVKKISENTLRVYKDNWSDYDTKILRLGGNEGCGGCSAGWYDLTELNDTSEESYPGSSYKINAVITNVEFEDAPQNDYGDIEGCYRIFVYCENKKIKLAEFEGGDGNGYYGTGYWIEVYE